MVSLANNKKYITNIKLTNFPKNAYAIIEKPKYSLDKAVDHLHLLLHFLLFSKLWFTM